MTTYEIILAVLQIISFLVLAILTAVYANQTKKLRRENLELVINLHDPGEDEWVKDTALLQDGVKPHKTYLRLKGLIVNPGLTPVIVTKIEETESATGNAIKGQYIFPKNELAKDDTYIFCTPWVIPHDDFSIWYRVYELDATTFEDYNIKIIFTYEVGKKTIIGPPEILKLKPHKIPTP